jgi:hypothetical protein
VRLEIITSAHSLSWDTTILVLKDNKFNFKYFEFCD